MGSGTIRKTIENIFWDIAPGIMAQYKILTKDLRLCNMNTFIFSDRRLLDGNKDIVKNAFNNPIIDTKTVFIIMQQVANLKYFDMGALIYIENNKFP